MSARGTVLGRVLGEAAKEVVRQVGAGIREYLRKRTTATKPVPPPPPDPFARLREVLMGFGFKAPEVQLVVAHPDVQATATKPIEDQVRVALRILRP